MSAPISFQRPSGGGGGGNDSDSTPCGSSSLSSPPAASSDMMMAFSPSNMTPRTLDRLRREDTTGPVPLQTTWTFWLDKTMRNATAAEYKAGLRKIYSVSTAQGFWSVYHHIPDVSELSLRCYYHLMREERPPLWEDPVLAKGGVWRIKCAKKDTSRLWRELLLAAIGEQFTSWVDEGDDVCGLSVSPRERDDLLQIWTLDAKSAVRDGTDGERSRLMEKVHSLVPDVRFIAQFYKPHQTHSAFEGARRF